MGDTQIHVEFAGVENTAVEFQQTWRKLEGEFADLDRSVKLLIATWEGPAQVAYNGYQAKWNLAAADVNRVLGQIGGALQQVHDTYQALEDGNAKRWGG